MEGYWYKVVRRSSPEDHWHYAGIICSSLKAAKKQVELMMEEHPEYQYGIFEIEEEVDEE